jgi:hypothetical protein
MINFNIDPQELATSIQPSREVDHYRESERLLEQEHDYPFSRTRKLAEIHAILAVAQALRNGPLPEVVELAPSDAVCTCDNVIHDWTCPRAGRRS